ncbi:MAG: hypothetical protein ACLQMF_10945 [Rectinemataceae bacterium]
MAKLDGKEKPPPRNGWSLRIPLRVCAGRGNGPDSRECERLLHQCRLSRHARFAIEHFLRYSLFVGRRLCKLLFDFQC